MPLLSYYVLFYIKGTKAKPGNSRRRNFPSPPFISRNKDPDFGYKSLPLSFSCFLQASGTFDTSAAEIIASNPPISLAILGRPSAAEVSKVPEAWRKQLKES